MMVKVAAIVGFIAVAVTGAVIPDITERSAIESGHLTNVARDTLTYNSRWTAVLNVNGDGSDHGIIPQKTIANTSAVYAVEASFYLPPIYSGPQACLLKLDLVGQTSTTNWATTYPPHAPDPELKITTMTGTLDPVNDYIDGWASAKRGDVWNDTIKGCMDPNTLLWNSKGARGICQPGDNFFLVEPAVKGMFVWWNQTKNWGPNGLKLVFA